jgi:endoglucanase
VAIGVVALALAAPAAAASAGGRASPADQPAPAGHDLIPGTRLFVPPPSAGALQQVAGLLRSGDRHDARLLESMLRVPQAVWLDSGTPAEVEQQVRTAMAEAARQRTEPVLVAYNIPGRDCAQYSAGGAPNESEYEAWIDAAAAGIGDGRAVVLVEPDALGSLPSDCLSSNPSLDSTNFPFTDAERFAELQYALSALEAEPNTAVYLDGTHSAWQDVSTIAQRLVEAGVQQAQGFFLNVSNYQFTTNNVFYGTWISDCIAYATVVDPGNFGACPGQYYNGSGPLSPYGTWSNTSPSTDLNTSYETAHYATLLGSTQPATHFVIDTSRNGLGPNDMSAYGPGTTYNQPPSVIATLQAGNWCNPPHSGLGLQPDTSTGVPLLDAYLWVKTPGESDGQCDAAGGVRAWDYAAYTQPGWPTTTAAQALFDPLWGLQDPGPGVWFPQQALMLAQDANPPLVAPRPAHVPVP